MLATGVVALSECIFIRWHQYKHRAKQQQQRQQRVAEQFAMEIYQRMPVESVGEDAQDAASPLGFDFDGLELQEQNQQQQFFHKQSLAELKELKQQLRTQQHNFEQKFEQQEPKHKHYVQRLQLGMDTQDQRHNSQMQRVKRQFDSKQATLNEQNEQIEQMTQEQICIPTSSTTRAQ